MTNLYDLWGKICSHQVTGLMYHFQFADMFYFLGLDNLGKKQECHYREESEALRENHRFVLKHHSKILTQRHAEGVELIPNTWARYTATDVDKGTRKSQVMSIFERWLNWEMQTKELYTDVHTQMMEQHAIVDACRVKDLILAVDEEIKRIHCCVHKLNICEYSAEAMLSL